MLTAIKKTNTNTRTILALAGQRYRGLPPEKSTRILKPGKAALKGFHSTFDDIDLQNSVSYLSVTRLNKVQ